MALPLQDTSGNALAVSWIRANFIAPLILSSQQGYATVTDNTRVTEVNPVDMFYATIDSKPGDTAVVIVNALPTPLDLVEMYVKHGFQSGYPAVCDLNGGTLTRHRIPPSRSNPLDGSRLYGMGMWAFNDNLAGTCGAMKFCYNGKLTNDPQQSMAVGPFIGVAWRIGLGFYGDQTGVTTDVETNYGDLQTFYDKTADDTGKTNEAGKEITVCAGYKYRSLSTECVTLYVRKNSDL